MTEDRIAGRDWRFAAFGLNTSADPADNGFRLEGVLGLFQVVERPLIRDFSVRFVPVNGRSTLYASPDGVPGGAATRESPVDIHTAIACASPGCEIILLDGLYRPEKPIVVERDVSGLEGSPIHMHGERGGRAVFDFGKRCAGFTFAGSYWEIDHIDCLNTADFSPGIALCGHDIHLHHARSRGNGDVGIVIWTLLDTDTRDDWPHDIQVTHCLSCDNSDPGATNADGFAAKLTVGPGIVFDRCVACFNADDGWDLFTKVELGATSPVVIKNCVAFQNGFDPAGRRRGYGNGFKLALVKKLQILSFAYHKQAQSGQLLSKLISDVQFVEMLIYDRLQDVLHLIIDVLIVLCLALLRYPPMLLFYVTIIPVSLTIIRSFTKPILRRKTVMRRRTEGTNAAFKEMLEMDELTRAHGLQQLVFRRISRGVRRVQDAAQSFDTVNVAVNTVTFGGFQGFRLLCLCFAAYLFTRGHISMGTVVLFQFLFDMMLNSVQTVLNALPQITQGYDSLASISEILCEKDVEHSGNRRLAEPIRGEIELRNLSFAYESERPVLRDIDLRMPEGKVVALVGESGSGKSTLLSLILGLYSPTDGEVRIDGVNLADLDINDFRRHVALVPQNSKLFSGTLWDNLTFGLEYINRAQVLEVIRSVGLEDMLSALPDGLNTVILEGGGNLSGGQRQRVAIARALLRNARIVLFDEATSALDAASEAQVQRAIEAMLPGRTVVMVAHRLNTLSKADFIYRIEDGKATLCPSYESLIEGPAAPAD